MAAPLSHQLQSWLDTLEQGLLERQTAIRLSLLAALAGEHVLLIGPPGTAKSELARRLHRVFAGAPYFERLLTRFSTPEELFGPLSLKALEADRYERLTQGYLPTAGIAFLDEVFKANSAILNALLTLLNEREFDNGSGRLQTPLISVVAASNELPTDESLRAFFDRFLVRVPVAPVSDHGFADLLRLADHPSPAPAPLTITELTALQAAAAQVVLSDEAVQACTALRAWLGTQGRGLSDRRWRQWIGLMRMAAACEGRPSVDALDLWLAPYVAAEAPDDTAALAAWFAAECVKAPAPQAPWLERAVEAFERQLELEDSASDDPDAQNAAGKLALARAISGADGSDDGLLRIVSTTLEQQTRRRYSSVHIAARLAQVDEVMAQAQALHDGVAAQARALAARLAGRFWWPPALVAEVVDGHAQAVQFLAGLLARLQQTRAGFAGLTVDERATGPVPAPIPIAAAA